MCVQLRVFSLWAALFLAAALKLSAQGTAISYQGRLSDSGAPANTNYDFRFAVFDAPAGGTNVSVWLTNSAVPVSNGLFTVTLDFGPGVFNGTSNGSNEWLDISVRAIGVTNFTALTPRQPILPVPYALFATSASNVLGALPISGTYSNTVNFSNGTNTFTGTFTGNGGNLTNLNASQITSGTLADARLSGNVDLLNASQTFTGSKTFDSTVNYFGTNYYNGTTAVISYGTGNYYGVNTFSNNGNTFVGSFFGNGLVGWVPISSIALQAARDHGYMLTSPSLTTVTLPATAGLTPGDIVRVSGAGAGGWLVAENSGQFILGNFASYRNSFLLAGATGNDWRRAVSSSDATRMYASGNLTANSVYYSTDFGHSWSPTTITGSGWFALACSANGNTIFAAPTGGASPIQVSYNGGLTFASLASSTATWNAIACSADGTKFIASEAGSNPLWIWNNGTFSPSGLGNANWSVVACSGDGNNLAAAISSGNIGVSTTGGSTWNFVAAPASANCTALAAAATGQKLVAAYLGGIATSTNFGTSWTVTSAPALNWSCLAASSDCNQLVAGVNNGLFYASANFGATWTPITSTNQYWSGACLSADGTKFAATAATVGGITGGIYYSSTSAQPNTISTNSTICGNQGSAVELQYIGNGQFMPVSSTGLLWAN